MNMLKYTLKVLIPLTIIFIAGCTGKSPVPQTFVSDLDEIRELTDEEKKENEEIYNNFNLNWMRGEQSKRIYKQLYVHLNSEFEPDASIILDQLDSKEDHKKLASIVFEVDKMTPSIFMAKNCIRRIEHIYLKKQLEHYRNKLKNAEDSFKEDSNLILKISEIQNKMNSIKIAAISLVCHPAI